jgi:hypothetical protein
MKKVFHSVWAVIVFFCMITVMAACSSSDDDNTVTPSPGTSGESGSMLNESFMGSYSGKWSIDNGDVDTATVVVGPQITLSHLPELYITKQVFPDATSFVLGFKTNYITMDYAIYSASAASASIILTPKKYVYTVQVNGLSYRVAVWFDFSGPYAIYSGVENSWTVLVNVCGLTVTDMQTSQVSTYTYGPELAFMYQTENRLIN